MNSHCNFVQDLPWRAYGRDGFGHCERYFMRLEEFLSIGKFTKCLFYAHLFFLNITATKCTLNWLVTCYMYGILRVWPKLTNLVTYCRRFYAHQNSQRTEQFTRCSGLLRQAIRESGKLHRRPKGVDIVGQFYSWKYENCDVTLSAPLTSYTCT